MISPPPIPVPRVRSAKFFAFLPWPNLFSARAAQFASFSTETETLNFFLRSCFRFMFAKSMFGVQMVISFLRKEATPIPIGCFL